MDLRKVFGWIAVIILAIILIGWFFGVPPMEMTAIIAGVIVGTIQGVLDAFGIIT